MSKKDQLKTTLIITEKPQAASKIAEALSNKNEEKVTTKEKVFYYEFFRDGRRFIVGCAVGHLFGINQKAKRGPFPNFDVEWAPAYTKKASAFSKKYLDVLKKLVKESSDFIVATDFDVEGEVIGWNIIRFVAKKSDAKRMKFSSLTKESIEESYKNVLPSLNWGAAIAGETRHYLDWYYGINLSRGLMRAISSTGKFRILSIGRVQGPALNIVAEREKEIKNFKSKPFWQVFLNVSDLKGQKLEVKHPKDIFKKEELARFKLLVGKDANAITKISEKIIKPPTPFDLTTLQTESYKRHGFTPSQTLRIAQDLYLAGVISYPRTSSQKYPKSIGYQKILEKLKKYTTLVKYAKRKTPIQGKKEDPAHPAIYPTGELKKLTENQKKIYDLIAKRFISCFCEDMVAEEKKVEVETAGLKFVADGLKIKEKGWSSVYPSQLKESEIPTMEGKVDINEIRVEEKETKPPKRYTAASLVKELEKRGLGTKATRAAIVETLYSRGYITGKSIELTTLGEKLIEALKKYSPIILDENLTRKMTQELEKIEVSSDNLEEMEKKVLEEAKKTVTQIAEEILKNLKAIGKSLADANEKVIEKEREESTLGKCPVCKKGNLRVMFGKKFSRYFVSCDAYPKCKTVFSLPPKGAMKPSRDDKGNVEKCVECGFPIVLSLRKGRMPWKICFNPDCPSNEELKRKKEEFKEKLKNGEIKIDDNGKIIEIGENKKN